MTVHTLAIDLGGTKIDLCRVSAEGRILWHKRVPTCTLQPGSMSFFGRVLDLVDAHLEDSDARIGVSWNTVVKDGRISRASLLGGEANIDIGKAFSSRFQRPVRVESDVHAMARGEHAFGVGSRYPSFLLINMGSGFGIAYHDQRVMRGHTGSAGAVWQERHYVPEIGEHIILDQLLSGRGLARLYSKLAGRVLSGVEVAGLVGRDQHVETAFAIIARHLGAFLVSASRLFDPAAIVLTGSVSKSASYFLPAAISRLNDEVEIARRPEAIVVSALEASACLGVLELPESFTHCS
jgi:glucokinase